MMHRLLRSSIVVAVLSVASTCAFAHAHPKVMSPDKDSTVSAPAEVSVVFSEGFEPKFSSLAVLHDKGVLVSKASTVLDPADNKHMTLALPKLTPGVYTVHWVASSTDGHKLAGDYTFTVK